MLLRVFRGRVLPGREDDFVALSRKHAADGGRSPGLLSFMAGYRRVDRADRFILVSTWQSLGDLERVVGEQPITRPRSAELLAGIAEMERVDQYSLLPPLHTGILDAPGAVLRVTEARIRPGRRAGLIGWLERKQREIDATRILLGWAVGMSEEGGVERAVAVSAWASPLQIEAMAEAGRSGTALFAAVDEFVTDITVEQYQAIELRLPERMHDVGGRRLIAARFRSGSDADRARVALESRLASAGQAGVSVARMADGQRREGDPRPDDQRIVVARVVLAEYLPAERLIADMGGQVVYEVDERPV